MDNPYQAPSSWSAPDAPSDVPPGAAPRRRGLVGHVRILAVLMVVQGTLELLMGVALLMIGLVLPYAVVGGVADAPPPGGSPAMYWVLTAVYLGMALVNLAAAVLHIFAGIRNYQFRNRPLGIVALSVGMATLLSIYCAPTAVCLGIYGLIVLLNREVVDAFALADQGVGGQDILSAFSP